jgi:hypothetical protein
MFSSTKFGERVQSGSYKRPNLAHSQTTAHPFPPLAASQPALTASQLPSSWSTSFSPQNSLSSSTRDGSGYLPGYLLSASQGMVSCQIFRACCFNTIGSLCLKAHNVMKILHCYLQRLHLMEVSRLEPLAPRTVFNICKSPPSSFQNWLTFF